MKLVIATIAATLASSTAFAGGQVAPVAAPQPVITPTDVISDWTGGYFGMQFGKGKGNIDATMSSKDVTADVGSFESDVSAYGVHGGYLHDFGKIVVGAELDFNKGKADNASITLSETAAKFANENAGELANELDLPAGTDFSKPITIPGEADVELLRLRGRVGYDFQRFLPYATLGVAKLSADDFDFSETGVSYGVGIDYKVTDSFTIGAEYSRQSFSHSVNHVFEGGDKLKADLDLDIDLIQIRGTYHF